MTGETVEREEDAAQNAEVEATLARLKSQPRWGRYGSDERKMAALKSWFVGKGHVTPLSSSRRSEC